jgi:glycosyltransferase involved in cell wall biosynthesis
VEAVVVVPTFRRPAMLARTLASLAAQETTVPFAVIVVENDATGREGHTIAQTWLADRAGLAVIETAQGNVHAINRGFATALETYPAASHILMMDDDEVASPRWLDQMVAKARTTGAAIIGGPVYGRFPEDTAPGKATHPVFTPGHAVTGPVPMIYGSGNCLIHRDVFERLGAPFFDARFNFLGGGDTDFFTRARHAGFAFHWVEEARIEEEVTPDRLRTGWIVRRGFRIGAINRALDLKAAGAGAAKLKVLAKDLAILGIAPFRAARALAGTGEPLIALHPLAVALGRIAAIFGAETQQYKASTGAPR